jgi:hypothetical protein
MNLNREQFYKELSLREDYAALIPTIKDKITKAINNGEDYCILEKEFFGNDGTLMKYAYNQLTTDGWKIEINYSDRSTDGYLKVIF